jgi:hypothetical protein
MGPDNKWLVDTLVDLFPDLTSFGFNGCHVVLTRSRSFLFADYHPPEISGNADLIEYPCETIHDLFLASPLWKKKEVFNIL